MRLLIDTNIILDVALQRPAFLTESSGVIGLCRTHYQGWIAWHTATNVFYLMRKHTRSWEAAMNFHAALLAWARVASVGHDEAQRAATLGMKDLEDAMQVTSAESCQAHWIVTRNPSDFSASTVPAITPSEFLSRFHPNLAP